MLQLRRRIVADAGACRSRRRSATCRSSDWNRCRCRTSSSTGRRTASSAAKDRVADRSVRRPTSACVSSMMSSSCSTPRCPRYRLSRAGVRPRPSCGRRPCCRAGTASVSATCFGFGRDEHGAAFVHGLDEAAFVGRDQRLAGRHGLQGHDAERLFDGHEHDGQAPARRES